ncbi:MAG TPA: hypothetical protein VIB60_00605, partial [Methylomirabilota bacterium]
KTFTGPVGYELRGLRITAGDDVAFGHGLARIRGDRTDGTRTDVWVRATVCRRKGHPSERGEPCPGAPRSSGEA